MGFQYKNKFLKMLYVTSILFTSNTFLYASAYIDCNGVVTVTKVEEVLKDDENPTALIDMKVKAKHFICEGHDAYGMPTGHLKRVRITIGDVIPKKNSKYFVSFSDGSGASFWTTYDDFSFKPSIDTEWEFIKKVHSTSYRPKGLKYEVYTHDYPLPTNDSGSFDGKHTPRYPYVPKKGVDLYAIEKAWHAKKEVKIADSKIPVTRELPYIHTYFSVTRPSTFTVQKEDNGVYFTSPDAKVRFYAYGIKGEGEPLAKGQKIGYAPSPFEKQQENETLLSQREVVEKKSKKDDYKYIASRYSTYQTKDAKHYHSFIVTRECNAGSSINIEDKSYTTRSKCRYRTIGIIYPNKKIFEQYKDDFMRFKDSFNMPKDKK